MAERFTKPFVRQEPIPEEGIAAAVEVMRSGALHRYGWPDGVSPAETLEERFAAWQGATHCLAVTSGGQAMRIALSALGIGPGDKVLTNAWTLAPVPGAIASVGATAVLVETTEDLVIDLADLAAKARASGAKTLLLSHMRGHVADMDALMSWSAASGVTVVEDCAHTMGAEWAGQKSGNFGHIACFSCQTY
ncbi:MAG: DegT/DnrJ/EryC1/StrS family aminotransferase, partial [Pseudomonadota bacterium]